MITKDHSHATESRHADCRLSVDVLGVRSDEARSGLSEVNRNGHCHRADSLTARSGWRPLQWGRRVSVPKPACEPRTKVRLIL